ncbi:hypothetical protein GmHk_12G034813 [Glycine max]|nr:hypothetical protein GmHk_12G034813 [Glycine max]
MKADIEAMKEQMTTMMEAMMSMRKMMEVNTATVVDASTATEVDQTHPSGLNQLNPPVSDMVRQGGEALGSTGGPHFNKHSFPPYGLPPNYTPSNVAHAPDENVNNSTPILIESQQPQSSQAQVPQLMGETHEVPRDHTLADSEPCLEYATEGQALGGAYPCQTLWGALSIADNHNPCILRERIEVCLRRGKFDYPALMNRKLGANGENKKEGGTHVVTIVPTWPNSHQLNNINTRPTSTLLITHHPISQEHSIIHKGHP